MGRRQGRSEGWLDVRHLWSMIREPFHLVATAIRYSSSTTDGLLCATTKKGVPLKREGGLRRWRR